MEANKMKAAINLMDLVIDALERPIIDTAALKLAAGQDVSEFITIQSEGHMQLSAAFGDLCPICDKYYEIEVRVYKNYGADWSEGWFFSINGDSHIFDAVEYASPQKAADALFEELSMRGYHACDQE